MGQLPSCSEAQALILLADHKPNRIGDAYGRRVPSGNKSSACPIAHPIGCSANRGIRVVNTCGSSRSSWSRACTKTPDALERAKLRVQAVPYCLPFVE